MGDAEFQEKAQQRLEQSKKKNMQKNISDLPPVWMPPSGRGRAILPTHSFQKIMNIEAPKIDSHAILNLTRLKNTWLGQFYRSHLRQNNFVRRIIQGIWHNGYPIYIKYVAIHFLTGVQKRQRPLIKLSVFLKKKGIHKYKLADATCVETPAPIVFPSYDQGYLVSPHDRYEFPEIFVAKIQDAMIYGGTNLVLVNEEVVCHDLYDFKRDYTSEELHGRTQINTRAGSIRWLLHDEAPVSIPAAASFVAACAPNYAHWITEVLPRIIMFFAEEWFKDVPIVVNDGLHDNIMESLFLVAGDDREIITLPIGRALAVDNLYLTSVAGYVPFERRTNKLSGHSHGLFSPVAFEKLCNKFNMLRKKADKEVWPQKIFLRRVSDIRIILNAVECEKLLVDRGYVIVEPEKLTFSQQVKLFSNAESIVAPSGAALANMVFSPTNAKIFILISKHPATSYWYWQNIACASGKNVCYVFGEASSNHDRGIHADYVVNLDELISCLDKEGL